MGFDEDEALRVIGVALLCTQASPITRPTMSRVVAMLSGDIEVSPVTAKPSYLSDWDLKDINSETKTFAESEISSSKTQDTHYNKPNDNNQVVDPAHTPLNITEPRVSDLIGEGR